MTEETWEPSKLNRNEKMGEDTSTQQILGWLARHGYPLELRIGQILRDNGYSVEHSRWYFDPETNKPRETDIFASIFQTVAGVRIAVDLVIECKSSLGKPWIVFAAPRNLFLANLDYPLVADQMSRTTLALASVRKVTIPDFLKVKHALAHGVTKAFSDNKSADPTAAYSAVRAAISGAIALGNAARERLSYGYVVKQLHIMMPIVVIDADLYSYAVTEEEETLVQVSEAQLIAGTSDRGDLQCVTIITAKYFPEWANSVAEEAEDFCEALRGSADSILKAVAPRSRREQATTDPA
jgi:hypothetical protein